MVALQPGETKILAIALESGFQDLGYFTRTFKQRVGVTPSAYRARRA